MRFDWRWLFKAETPPSNWTGRWSGVGTRRSAGEGGADVTSSCPSRQPLALIVNPLRRRTTTASGGEADGEAAFCSRRYRPA